MRFIFPETVRKNFNYLEELEFTNAITNLRKSLVRYNFSSVTDVLMSVSGSNKALIGGRFRITRGSLRRLLNFLMPYSYQVFCDLAGLKKKKRFPKDAYSLELAARFFNDVVTSRMPFLNKSHKFPGLFYALDDIVVSVTKLRHYNHFWHEDVYRVTRSFLKEWSFYAGALDDLLMCLYLINRERAVKVDGKTYIPLAHFSHSIIGKVIRFAPAWLDPETSFIYHTGFTMPYHRNYMCSITLTNEKVMNAKLKNVTSALSYDSALLEKAVTEISRTVIKSEEDLLNFYYQIRSATSSFTFPKLSEIEKTSFNSAYDRFGIKTGDVTVGDICSYILTWAGERFPLRKQLYYRELAGRFLYHGEFKHVDLSSRKSKIFTFGTKG